MNGIKCQDKHWRRAGNQAAKSHLKIEDVKFKTNTGGENSLVGRTISPVRGMKHMGGKEVGRVQLFSVIDVLPCVINPSSIFI